MIPLLIALTAANAALALTPAQTQSASTVKVYMAGVDGLATLSESTFSRYCQSETIDVFASAAPMGSSVHRVTSCTFLGAGLPQQMASLAGKNVALYRSFADSAAKTVEQVAQQQARSFLDISSCGVRSATVPNYGCTLTVQVQPNFGLIEAEPRIFNSPP